MRKGFGPTGLSFPYTFTDFQQDVALRDATETKLWVEVVAGGRAFTAAFDTDMAESDMRALYDALDNVTLVDGVKRFQLFTKGD